MFNKIVSAISITKDIVTLVSLLCILWVVAPKNFWHNN